MVTKAAKAPRPNSLGITLGVYVLWGLLIIGGQSVVFGNVSNLDDLVKTQVNIVFVTAVVLLLGVTFFFKWQRRVGLKPAAPPSSWLVIWPAALLILLFLGVALATGLPSTTVVLFVLINTLLVGVHEELMCRGILFQGLLPSLAVWPAILLTSFLFGAIHAFNGFLTGDFAGALSQAGAATLSGIWLLAVRLRTRSIYPAMLIHGLWDFAIFIMGLSVTAGAATAGSSNPLFGLLIPLPLALYGLWLLRGIGKQSKEEVLA
ncbi:MAG: CPBP family intramembrane metalloprotease [Chloroflexales bacterium]|nr:CPBP family intramembrane metalloprotease [Chloroflexales bacterium]